MLQITLRGYKRNNFKIFNCHLSDEAMLIIIDDTTNKKIVMFIDLNIFIS